MSVDVASLLSELASVPNLVAAQVRVGLPRSVVLDRLFSLWKGRFEKMTKAACCGPDKVALTDAINAVDWSSEQKTHLASLLIDCLDNGDTVDSTPRPKKRRNQRCLYLENYVPQNKWIAIKRATTKPALPLLGS